MPALSFEIFAVIGLCVVLGIVLRAYDRLLREYKKSQTERKELELKARHRAWRIVEEAKERALSILEEVKVDAEKHEGKMDEKMEAVTQKQLDHYKEVIQNISKDIENDAMREMREFKTVMESETVEAQKIIGNKMDQEYKDAEKDVAEYKERKITEFKNGLTLLTKEIIVEVLGKGVNYETHEEIILQSLEEARREHVI